MAAMTTFRTIPGFILTQNMQPVKYLYQLKFRYFDPHNGADEPLIQRAPLDFSCKQPPSRDYTPHRQPPQCVHRSDVQHRTTRQNPCSG